MPSLRALALLLLFQSGCAVRTLRGDLAMCEVQNEALSAVATTAAAVAETTAAFAELEGVAREIAMLQMESYRALAEELQDAFDTGDLEIVTRDSQMVVQLPGEILFDVGETRLTREGEDALDKIALVLGQHTDRRFLIAGHTDDLPVGLGERRYRSNWELSVLRAAVAVEYLVKAGVEPTQLIAAGFGEYLPLTVNDTADGRARNRRLEIVVLPKLGESPLPNGVALLTAPSASGG